MTPFVLLLTLRDLGVFLTPLPDGERLHIDAPAGVLTDAHRQAIREHKQALLDMAEWYEERAGILEYEAGLSRAQAEREAWTQMEARYAPCPPSPRRE
jgi:hypothetical protein